MDNNFNKKNDFIRLNKKYKSLFLNGLTATAIVYALITLNSMQVGNSIFIVIINIAITAVLIHATYKARQQNVIEVPIMQQARFGLIGVIVWQIILLIISYFQFKSIEASIVSDEFFAEYSDYYTQGISSIVRTNFLLTTAVIVFISLILYWQSCYEKTVSLKL